MFSTLTELLPLKQALPDLFSPAAAGDDASASLRLRFQQGLPGFPDVTDYQLRPAGAARDLLLLAAVDDARLRFLTLPYVPGWLPIEHGDLMAAAETAGIAEGQLAIVMMLNVQRMSKADETSITVNLRAPILIDTSTGMAGQHVLAHSRYDIRYPLRSSSSADRGDASGAR